ncbi:MAG TPA: AAA family ATPase [Rhizobacter sp.]
MYAKFFGLRQEPFSIAPDPRYLFMSERHREALAHLLYGLRGGGGFVLLTGEIGAGKTTVCRCFLEQIPKRCNVAYIFNPKLTVIELLRTVCEEFRIPLDTSRVHAESVKEYLDPINEFLLKTHAVGQNNVLIIDEAQNLSSEVLEQLRLLTNLETSERKLLQIILIGQPELRDMLARPELEQLAQRVIARYHLKALSEGETVQYIRHRLGVAGLSGMVPFDRAARKRIHELSRGVPRRINLLCDRSLLGAYADGRSRVSREMVDKAAAEVFGETEHPMAAAVHGIGRKPLYAAAAGLLAGAVLVGLVSWVQNDGAGVAAAVAASAVPSKAAVAATLASQPLGAASAASAVKPASKLALEAGLRSEPQALRELAAAWKVSLAEGDPCGVALRQQLNCFKSEDGGLAMLRSLDRPGVLTLYDDAGKPLYVLLTALGADSASLQGAGGATQTVLLSALAKSWRGEFATLWRSPPDYSGRLPAGQNGPVVDWVAQQVARAQGEPVPAASGTLDAALQERIANFQLTRGLKPDGRVGPITLMHLNRVAGVDEPRLQPTVASN